MTILQETASFDFWAAPPPSQVSPSTVLMTVRFYSISWVAKN